MKHDPLLQSLIQGTLKLENVAVQHNTPAGYTTLDQTQKATKENNSLPRAMTFSLIYEKSKIL